MRVRGTQILDWMQQVLGTQALLLVINVFTGVVAARILGPAGNGLFDTVMLWLGVGGVIAGAGIGQAFLVSYVPAASDARRGLLAGALMLSVAWPVLVAAGMILVIPHVIGHLGPGVTRWAELALLTLPFSGAVLVLQSLLTAEQAFGWFNALRIGQTLAMAAPLTVLWATGTLTPFTLLWVAVLGGIAGNAVIATGAVLVMRRQRAGIARPSVRVIGRLAHLSARFYAVGMASLFNLRLDQMLTTAWLSARDIGLYTVAGSSLTVVGMASGAFQTVFLPSVAGDERPSIIRRTETGFRRGAWVLLGLAGLTVAVARPVLGMLYGARYLPAMPAVMALMPAAITGGLLGVLYQGCFALLDTRTPLVGEVVGAVSGAVLLWVLVPRYGLLGAALSTSASYLLDLGAVLWLWRRHTGSGAVIPGWVDARLVVGGVWDRAKRVTGRPVAGGLI